MRIARQAALCLIASFVLGQASAAAQSELNPYGIFAGARAYWEAQRYPRNIEYVVVIRVSDGAVKTNHYVTDYQARTNLIYVDPVSSEERAHPHYVRGEFNFGIMGAPIGKPDPPTDWLGVPIIAPNYSFGIAHYTPPQQLTDKQLIAIIRREYPNPMPTPTPKASSSLKIIGDVTATHRHYEMHLLGTEPYAEGLAYHLALRPLEDPGKYRLRELWIDTKTGATVKLVSAGNFTDGPETSVRWTVTFKQIAGVQYIDTETSDGPLNFYGRHFSQASIAFEEIATPSRTSLLHPIFTPQSGEAILVEPDISP
ncbi:MAG: hypothetical protein M3Y21_09205 [Candidatus Eremiobacteraeota bacterium]|nr:hypothetical protein [Candidatus Eremiobacteraeota bacterium]